MSEEKEGKIGYKFPKDERIHHRSLEEGVFRHGKTFYEFPFRVTWRCLSPEELQKNFRSCVPEGIGKVQIMISVPKKKRKRAVDRVLMRRRIRESYRLSRHPLLELIASRSEVATMSVALVYIHDKNLTYSTVDNKIKAILQKLQSKFKSIP